MKINILAFAAHPDDVELSASGTLLKHKSMGKKTGIIDLTRGELGTRGTAEDRDREAREASKILQLDVRENLGMADGFFEVNRENSLKVIESIRAYRPDYVLANAPSDRHIDHGRAARLVSEACFLSGLRKIETSRDGKNQEVWRPKLVLHYIQDNFLEPRIVIDISEHFEQKIKSIKAFRSQFYDPTSNEPETPISSKGFLEFIEARARNMGRIIGCTYGEGFITNRAVGVDSLDCLG